MVLTWLEGSWSHCSLGQKTGPEIVLLVRGSRRVLCFVFPCGLVGRSFISRKFCADLYSLPHILLVNALSMAFIPLSCNKLLLNVNYMLVNCIFEHLLDTEAWATIWEGLWRESPPPQPPQNGQANGMCRVSLVAPKSLACKAHTWSRPVQDAYNKTMQAAVLQAMCRSVERWRTEISVR